MAWHILERAITLVRHSLAWHTADYHCDCALDHSYIIYGYWYTHNITRITYSNSWHRIGLYGNDTFVHHYIPLKIYVVRFHGLTRLLSLNPTEREGKEKKEGKKQTYAHTNVGIEKFPAVSSFVESERRQPNDRKRERAPKATSTDFYIIHYYMGARRFLIGYILECVSLYPHTNRPDKRLLIVYHQGCRCVYEWAKRLISRIDVTHNPPNVVYGVTALTVFFFDRVYKYWHSV